MYKIVQKYTSTRVTGEDMSLNMSLNPMTHERNYIYTGPPYTFFSLNTVRNPGPIINHIFSYKIML